jgi:hypothetical protein
MWKRPHSTIFCKKSVGISQELCTFAPDLQTKDEESRRCRGER